MHAGTPAVPMGYQAGHTLSSPYLLAYTLPAACLVHEPDVLPGVCQPAMAMRLSRGWWRACHAGSLERGCWQRDFLGDTARTGNPQRQCVCAVCTGRFILNVISI